MLAVIVRTPFVSVLVSTFFVDMAYLDTVVVDGAGEAAGGGNVGHVDFEAGEGAGAKHIDGQEGREELHDED